MEVPDSAITAETGAALVQVIVGKNLGWIVRPQLHADKGIDAHIEVVVGGKATGRLVALQIKSGPKAVGERIADGFVFRPKPKHVDYWLHHSLPVALVLVDVEDERAYWQLVTKETLISTGVGWKVVVPIEQTFSWPVAEALAAASEGDPYTLRLRQLQLARPWMEHLAAGGTLALEVEEWVNKTSGRASLLLSALDSSGTVVTKYEWPWIVLPMANYSVELPRMFPWATLGSSWDEDDSYSLELEADEGSDLRPAWDDGEVAHWRLDLELSELGQAFLLLDDALSNEVVHRLFGD